MAEKRPVLVYMFTGFLDSGKTSLIRNTCMDPDFMADCTSNVIISLEEGEVEYGEDWLKAYKSHLVQLDSYKDLTYAKLKEIDETYHPSQVMLEFNGTESVTEFLQGPFLEHWHLVQVITTIETPTFMNYVANMRSIMFEQVRYSDLVVFNRCKASQKKSGLRGNIKAMNRAAQIVYLDYNNGVLELNDDDLPYDLNAPVVDIPDDDYGFWYMDCAEQPWKYSDKTFRIRGKVGEILKTSTNSIILGRRAMVCCEQDTSMCGITVTGLYVADLAVGDWIEVEGQLKVFETDEGQNAGVLYATSAKAIDPLKDEYVYFN